LFKKFYYVSKIETVSFYCGVLGALVGKNYLALGVQLHRTSAALYCSNDLFSLKIGRYGFKRGVSRF
jgi:hypothetical protein